jgi:phage shock protein E
MRYRILLAVALSASLLALVLLRTSPVSPAAQASVPPAPPVATPVKPTSVPRATPVKPTSALVPTLDTSASPPTATLENPAIDMDGYLRYADEAAAHREGRRVSEAEFMRMAAEPGTIVLDARSAERYADLHIKGAINLSFPDITIESLRQTLPDKSARILIYCNNNFFGEEQAFPSKAAPASLNISTYIALYTYGYRNIYELGPLIDFNASILEFERGK